MSDVYAVIAAVVGGALFGFGAHLLYCLLVRRLARREAGQIIEDAHAEADRIIKESRLRSREEAFRMREQFQREHEEARAELKRMERRLAKHEDVLDRKVETLQNKERQLEELQRELGERQQQLERKSRELDGVLREQQEVLHRLSGLSPEEAKNTLLERLSHELEREQTELITKVKEKTCEIAESEARNLIATAIQRYAADHTAECVVSTVDLPNEEMKGRIIGREGRNIRAFESATGIDVIVDDTPGVVVVSGFDSVRREMARRAMKKLVSDGRIHPARIEEVVEATKKEMEQLTNQTGKHVCYDLDIHGVHPKLVSLLGRLKFRTSYGQNVLQHSIEVAQLTGLLAGEMKLDVSLARRCGLLHDIGKAVDQEMEGGHPAIGAELLKRFDEREEVVESAAGHHEDIEPRFIYTRLVGAADAISASRPGARRETLEKYIRRLERLEAIAGSFEGVENAYAIQAGREIRVVVNAHKVDDKHAVMLCREIAREIERELNYPGEIKVTLIRETRIVEYAR
jgi:ribonuclease Y